MINLPTFTIFAALTMRSTAFKYGSLIIGIIAAVVIILSQSLSFEYSPNGTKQTAPSEENAPQSDAGVSELTISATSFPASAQINFIQQATCLFEVVFSDVTTFPVHEAVELPLNKFFSSILGVLISPNAP
jgi:hypothetical protein